jgi:hypothetical protein
MGTLRLLRKCMNMVRSRKVGYIYICAYIISMLNYIVDFFGLSACQYGVSLHSWEFISALRIK